MARARGRADPGGRRVQGRREPACPEGRREGAPPRRRRRSASEPVAALTTDVPPDRALLRESIAGSLAAHKPFVVTFATPRFCTSRVCGPVVDVVQSVARRFSGSGIRFIHVEVYRDNDPTKGYNRWMQSVGPDDGALDVPRRPRRPDQGRVRGPRFRRRARRAPSAPSWPRVSAVAGGEEPSVGARCNARGARSRSCARHGAQRLLRVLREVGVVGDRPATREGAVEFRRALEELGTTYLKLGQLLSSRPDLLPDVYIEELGKLVDEVPPLPVRGGRAVIARRTSARARSRGSSRSRWRRRRSRRSTRPCSRTAATSCSRCGGPGSSSRSSLDLDVIRSTVGFLDRRSETAQLLQLRALAEELEVHLRAELELRRGGEQHGADRGRSSPTTRTSSSRR